MVPTAGVVGALGDGKGALAHADARRGRSRECGYGPWGRERWKLLTPSKHKP